MAALNRTATDARMEAWYDESPGAEVLADVESFIAEYVAFPTEHALVAATLWAAHAHAFAAFESSPRLALLSPEPGSGKTRVLEVLEVLCPGPMHVLSASAAAIFRSIQEATRTLLFDECDAIFGRRGTDDSAEDLRALLNAGHRKGATIPRCVGPKHEVREFAVYAPVALAGLGDLPDTLMSRSVIIRMRRRKPGESVTPYRRRIAEPRGRELAARLASWAAHVFEDLSDAWPEMPEGVTDRPADTWEALLAVADAAGGDWPARARAACVALANANVSREASLGVKLLTDLRAVFGDEDKLATEELLRRLHDLEESPWSDLRGKPLDARGLARRLVNYEITSTKVRIGEESLRGYRREDLWDAWQRYLPVGSSPAGEGSPSPFPGEAEPAEQPEQTCSEPVARVPLNGSVPEHAQQAEHETPPLTCDVPPVPHVPDSQGGDSDVVQVGAWCDACGGPVWDKSCPRCQEVRA